MKTNNNQSSDSIFQDWTKHNFYKSDLNRNSEILIRSNKIKLKNNYNNLSNNYPDSASEIKKSNLDIRPNILSSKNTFSTIDEFEKSSSNSEKIENSAILIQKDFRQNINFSTNNNIEINPEENKNSFNNSNTIDSFKYPIDKRLVYGTAPCYSLKDYCGSIKPNINYQSDDGSYGNIFPLFYVCRVPTPSRTYQRPREPAEIAVLSHLIWGTDLQVTTMIEFYSVFMDLYPDVMLPITNDKARSLYFNRVINQYHLVSIEDPSITRSLEKWSGGIRKKLSCSREQMFQLVCTTFLRFRSSRLDWKLFEPDAAKWLFINIDQFNIYGRHGKKGLVTCSMPKKDQDRFDDFEKEGFTDYSLRLSGQFILLSNSEIQKKVKPLLILDHLKFGSVYNNSQQKTINKTNRVIEAANNLVDIDITRRYYESATSKIRSEERPGLVSVRLFRKYLLTNLNRIRTLHSGPILLILDKSNLHSFKDMELQTLRSNKIFIFMLEGGTTSHCQPIDTASPVRDFKSKIPLFGSEWVYDRRAFELFNSVCDRYANLVFFFFEISFSQSIVIFEI